MENEKLSSKVSDDPIAKLETLLKEYLEFQYEFLTALNSFDSNGASSESIAEVREKSRRLFEVTGRIVSTAALLKVHVTDREPSHIEALKEHIRQDFGNLNPAFYLQRLGDFSQQLETTSIEDEHRSGLQVDISQLSETLQNWDRTLESLIYDLDVPGLSEALRSQERRRSLLKIVGLGFDPYPHKFDRTHSISQIVQQFANKTGEELEAERPQARVAGRIHAINKMGKAAFVRFSDGAELLQVYIKSNEVDDRTWALFKLLDLGDFIGTEGRLFRTRTGELSIHAESLTFLAKALKPPPDKYYGLHDVELRYRQRYADLIANREVRRVFETRSQIIRLIRGYFDERGYMEVETPMLTPLPTGAAARPFKTHHNALDIDLYARIAPELYLKRLIVGGFEKVYEINRNFRNEGIDRSHNPEFTMLEWYEAYSEYEDLMKLTEELISTLVSRICEKSVIVYGDKEIDFTRPWKQVTMRKAIVENWTHPWETESVPIRALARLARSETSIPHDPGQCESCDWARKCQLQGPLLPGSEMRDQVETDSKVSTIPTAENVLTTENDAFPSRECLTVEALSTSEGILRWAEREPSLKSHIPHLRSLDYGHLLGEVFEHVAEAHLINPTFITEFPTELSPLSKQNQSDSRFVDRFELFISGMEIANAFCEINDPVDQRQRFEAQMKLRERGDEEAMVIDEDYIRALSYGMPPTAGEGIGIDRLVMVLTNSRSIRDVILFPHMRPETSQGGRGAEEQRGKQE